MDDSIDMYQSHIYKSGKGYQVDYYYKDTTGKVRHTCKRFDKKCDAKNWRDNCLKEEVIRRGHEKTPEELLTMGELIEEYKKFSRARRQASTCETKENIINNMILPYFKDMHVREVTRTDISNWQTEILNKRKSDGGKYSRTYCRTINNQLTAILNYAVRYHDLPVNPALQIERMGSKMPEKPREFWEVDEFEKFIHAIEDQNIAYYAFQVLFWCGLRLGEMQALTVKDVDFNNGVLHVMHSYSKEEKTQGSTKTENGVRDVHMPSELTEELKEYLSSIKGLTADSQVFPISKSEMHRVMTEGSAKAGVKRITIHGLRHSHITMLINCVHSASIRDIANRAGHSSPDITMIYAHSYANKDKLIADELDNIMRKGETDVS